MGEGEALLRNCCNDPWRSPMARTGRNVRAWRILEKRPMAVPAICCARAWTSAAAAVEPSVPATRWMKLERGVAAISYAEWNPAVTSEDAVGRSEDTRARRCHIASRAVTPPCKVGSMPLNAVWLFCAMYEFRFVLRMSNPLALLKNVAAPRSTGALDCLRTPTSFPMKPTLGKALARLWVIEVA